ncbi:DUF4230 domain-containing protein [Kytococcus sedentarius]|uniref:DUF4230 domain-containing protein n=1 Tax=Kytococcus sedentarius (strain ATCC 14392 / DSM 20547 / JCM 11482 / CCUG 33030 / NBRC 15357 / NCTC 11040 / CCM 314 / 541) TaxID=478801 RepID=C7NJ08_KYTSD|nr:DUF4230 domain-containing protein [Kytococcus sedentarius]ACV05233.1 hypothetical protein Ksed_01420 [Kytococcus sedentarius DSM 20547]QQB63695.1 DUF4230 domain-containing protein [Kytococcus sedentarius]STX13361.1 Uncharacterised protein [Kytococcus sedentarius]
MTEDSGATAITHGRPRGRRLSGCLWAVIGAVVALALLLAAVALFGGSLLSRWSLFETETVDRTGPSVLKQLEDIEEFHAATGYFETVVDLEKDTEHLPGWISGERILYVGKGEVDAVVDFSGLGEQSVTVSEDGSTVEVSLPEPVLDEPSLDVEESYVVEHDRGLADRFKGSELEAEAQKKAVEQMREAASGGDTGMVQRAEHNTTAMLESLLGAAGFETVEVTYDAKG